MKVIIPMAGSGDRYVRAGYREPKPLIRVDGCPMIQHVIEMFPGEEDFVFICNEEHLRSSPLEFVLRQSKPKARIVSVNPHKLGPVYTVCQALDTFDDDEEVIVNYCDFGVYWDYHDFLYQLRQRHADGAMSAYRGFHPHSLGPTLYAYIRERDNWMEEIKEKGHFTNNRMQEFASSGTFYFAKGDHIKTYFPELMRLNITVLGEFYVSMVYNLLHEAGLRTYIYELEDFLQWGTPLDLEEYQYWSDQFLGVMRENDCREDVSPDTYNLMLMAGRGVRFVSEGYTEPKPLVRVAGKPMVVEAIRSLPRARRWGFVCLREHLDGYPITEILMREVGEHDIVTVEHVTEGQACTALLARDRFDLDGPLLIAACDSGMTWDIDAYEHLLSDESIDAIVWTFRRHASLERNPGAFGWVEVEGNRIKRVSVKVPISSTPRNDHAIIGTFFFRRGRDFVRAAEEMIVSAERVGHEFYIDQVINYLLADGKKAVVFEVRTCLNWGTPNDLRTYHYWLGYFQKLRLAQARRSVA